MSRRTGCCFPATSSSTGACPTSGQREKLVALVPGHGSVTQRPAEAISQTRRYLEFLRAQMAKAVARLEPFDEAYAKTDWSEFRDVPAFGEANRRNAYQVYLEMEAEALDGDKRAARKRPRHKPK